MKADESGGLCPPYVSINDSNAQKCVRIFDAYRAIHTTERTSVAGKNQGKSIPTFTTCDSPQLSDERCSYSDFADTTS